MVQPIIGAYTRAVPQKSRPLMLSIITSTALGKALLNGYCSRGYQIDIRSAIASNAFISVSVSSGLPTVIRR